MNLAKSRSAFDNNLSSRFSWMVLLTYISWSHDYFRVMSCVFRLFIGWIIIIENSSLTLWRGGDFSALDSRLASPGRALAGDIVLCPWTICCVHGHYVLSMDNTCYSHSASLYPGVQMDTGEFNSGGRTCNGLASHSRGVEILLVASCYRNQDKLRPDRPLGLLADFTPLTYLIGHKQSMLFCGVPKM